MAKRGANEGTIYQRKDGRWEGVLNLGYVGGKRQRKSFYAATQAEVHSRMVAAARGLQLGRKPVPEREKLEDFLNRWLEDTARRSVRITTYTIYEVSLRLHIIPEIGHLKLARLSADDLDALYSRLLDKGLSPKTVRMIHAVIHRALSHGRRRGMVAANVADDVDPPKAPRREFHAFSPQEAARFLAAAVSDRLYALYCLALNSGMRQAELLGLRWGDVDLDRAVLHVRQQVCRMAGEWHFSEPKTKAGRRTISLSGACVAALREHHARQLEERLRAKDWQDMNLVFVNQSGCPLDKGNLLRRSFAPLLERAGLPRVRFHDLRHSCASLLLAEGVHPKVVQEMLGHSTISVTMDTYSHTLPSMGAEAAERLGALLAANS